MSNNLDVVRQFVSECVNGGDFASFSTLVAPDFVNHNRLSSGQDQAIKGRETFKNELENLRRAVSDYELRVVEAFEAAGGRVVLRAEVTGHFKGPLGTLPALDQTKTLKGIPVVTIFRLTEGSLVERWNVADWAELNRRVLVD